MTKDEELKAAQEALKTAEIQIDAYLKTALEAIEETKTANKRIAELEQQVRDLEAALCIRPQKSN